VGGGIDKEISCINFVLMSGVVTTEYFLGITKAHNPISNYRDCGFYVILG